MAEIDLNFLARQNERIHTELGSLRDDIRVLSAIVIRLDNTRERHEALLTDMLTEMRAMHQQGARVGERLRKLEENAEQ